MYKYVCVCVIETHPIYSHHTFISFISITFHDTHTHIYIYIYMYTLYTFMFIYIHVYISLHRHLQEFYVCVYLSNIYIYIHNIHWIKVYCFLTAKPRSQLRPKKLRSTSWRAPRAWDRFCHGWEFCWIPMAFYGYV